MDVSIEEFTLGNVNSVPCDRELQLFVVRAGFIGYALLTGCKNAKYQSKSAFAPKV